MTGPPRSGRVEVSGGSIAYDDTGSGPAVVLLHEAIADRRMWQREVERFGDRYRLVRVELRGYGLSSPATAPFSYFQDLRAVIDRLRLDRPLIVGPSVGGQIAVDFAVEYPGVSSGLLLLSPAPPSGTTTEMLPEAADAFAADDRASQAIAAAWKAGDLAGALERMRVLWCPALEGANRELFRTMVTSNAEEVFGDRSAQHHVPPSPRAIGRLDRVGVPVEILVGGRDNPVQPLLASFLSHRLPNARLHQVAEADHLLNLSAPHAFDRALTRMMDELAPRS